MMGIVSKSKWQTIWNDIPTTSGMMKSMDEGNVLLE
jgi:hypothetical protein